MTMRRSSAAMALGLLVAAAACRPQSKSVARFLEQSARQDLDQAALVVLGKAVEVHDGAPQPGVAGFRPVEVKMEVLRVLKGRLTSRSARFTYFFPYGGYDGPGAVWVEQGQVGIVALVPDRSRLRVVNDRRAMIRAYGTPEESPLPLDQFVAQATIPVRAGCSSSVSSVAREMASDLAWISNTLIGARHTRKLLQSSLASREPNVSACACLVMAELWKLPEPCLDALPSDAGIDHLRAENQELDRYQRDSLRRHPASQLKTLIESSGLDGTLLRLASWSSRPGLGIGGTECRAFSDALGAGDLSEALASGAKWSSPSAERSAMAEFRMWLALGCPAAFPELATPPDANR
jgi:hypothetical protein